MAFFYIAFYFLSLIYDIIHYLFYLYVVSPISVS